MNLGDKVKIKASITPKMIKEMFINQAYLDNPSVVTDIDDPDYTEIDKIYHVPNHWLEIVPTK